MVHREVLIRAPVTEPYNKACGQVKIVTMCLTPTTAQRAVATENTQPEDIPSCAIPQRETSPAVQFCKSTRRGTSRAEQPAKTRTCRTSRNSQRKTSRNEQFRKEPTIAHVAQHTRLPAAREPFVLGGKTFQCSTSLPTCHRERRLHTLGCPWSCELASSSR